MELPTYSTKPNITRILFPKIALLLLLSSILYTGVRINFVVFNMTFPMVANAIVILIIIILALIEIVNTEKKAKDSKIYFFNSRIEVRGKEETTIILNTINNIEIKKSMVDKLLNTGTLVLNTGQTIKDIKYPERIRDYILQLKGNYPAAKNKV